MKNLKPKTVKTPFSPRTILGTIILVLLISNLTIAQPRKGQFIKASIGYGISTPYANVDIHGSGFYAQGEYVYGVTKWFGVRPYAALLLTKTSDTDIDPSLSEYEINSRAFLLGGKIRVAIPIPWFAPYLETGIGASLGSFETITPPTSIEKNGLIMHIPFTMGVALGPKHSIEIEFAYYFHPSAKQFNGAMALGLSFPIN